MRITGGVFKGRIVNAPNNLNVRPTTDFAKVALFNLLANRVEFNQIKVLDLCCGIGGVSFEFLSRECMHLTSVDSNRKTTDFVKDFSSKLGLKNHKVICRDVLKFLDENNEKFDVIFADPPYDSPIYETLVEKVIEKYKEQNILFIIEHPETISFSGYLGFNEQRKYGKVNFSLFSL